MSPWPLDFSLADLKSLKVQELETLVMPLRAHLIQACQKKGGHLASSLGVVELTLALHHVFASPKDQIIFDVGHQSYPHKVLTGRAQRFAHLRQAGGLAAFTDPGESVHDANISGHAGNALSVTLGLSQAEPTSTKIAVIGDGSLGNGHTFEALNQLAHTKQNILLILNDNGYAIDRNVGALANQNDYQNFFASFGLPYIGPVDGHNLTLLLATLKQLKTFSQPRVLHIKTIKGKGLPICEADPVKNHYFCQRSRPSFKLQALVGETLVDLAKKDSQLQLITPAMAQGGGLNQWAQKFPERFFDVGIAEGHAVAFAAGQALKDKHVIVHLYASFMQRAFDQLVHDVALNHAPVTLLIDRAGLVGEDGATHQGTLALGLLNLVPQLKVLAPGDEVELVQALTTLDWRQPTAILYPKTEAVVMDPKTVHLTKPLTNICVKQTPRARGLIVTTGWTKKIVTTAKMQLPFNHWHCPVLKPFPLSTLQALQQIKLPVLVLEEYAPSGGLGQIITAALANTGQTVTRFGPNSDLPPSASRKQQLVAARLHQSALNAWLKKQAVPAKNQS